MQFESFDGVRLEALVRKVYDCERFALGGLADSEVLTQEPFTAALLCLAPHRLKAENAEKIDAFLATYRPIFLNPEAEDHARMEQFIRGIADLLYAFEESAC